MAEFDKKIQNLVQSVLEASEKKNAERVDILITTAIKHLKRFKPDHTTYLSLTYLAKLNPKLFQSTTVKDNLKTLLRRDNSPPNTLPILAANILLACCDSNEIRSTVLSKIDQWISSNQKVIELVQLLLVTLCTKCQGDEQSIASLIEMRSHWMQYIVDNSHAYSLVPSDICAGIRKLLLVENQCQSIILCLKFLCLFDNNINELGAAVDRFILERPISLASMLDHKGSGPILYGILVKIYTKLFKHLKKANPTNGTETNDTNSNPVLFVKLPNYNEPVAIDRLTIEAVFTLMSMFDQLSYGEEARTDFQLLLDCWVVKSDSGDHIPTIYYDIALTKPYVLPEKLRRKLIHSSLDTLIEFGLSNTTTNQLVALLMVFGSPLVAINKMLERLNSINLDLVKAEIKDVAYFEELMKFYHSMGAIGVPIDR